MFLDLTMAESSLNSNHWTCMNPNDFYWAFTPAKVVIYQSESRHSSYLIWQAFRHMSSNFPPFRQVWSLSFLWSSLQHFYQFFCLIFLKWDSTLCKIYWILDLQLLNLACFMVANTWDWKSADSWLFLTRSFQDEDFWTVLNRGWQRVKTLEILVEFF